MWHTACDIPKSNRFQALSFNIHLESDENKTESEMGNMIEAARQNYVRVPVIQLNRLSDGLLIENELDRMVPQRKTYDGHQIDSSDVSSSDELIVV